MDKGIKVTISLDDAAFSKAKRSISELITEVNKLAEATSKVGLFGGGSGLRVGNTPSVPGAGSSTSSAFHHARGTGFGGGDVMAKAVASTASAMKTSVKEGTTALGEFDKAFKALVANSSGGVRELLRVFSSLSSGFSRVTQAFSGDSRSRVPSLPEDPRAMPMQSPVMEWWKEGGARKTGLMGNWLAGGRAAAGPLAGPPPTAGAGGILSGIGWAGLIGGGAAIGAGIYGAGRMVQGVVGMERKADLANIDYQMKQPFFDLSRKAELGGIFGGSALAIRGGDIALGAARRRLVGTAEGRTINSPQFRREYIRKLGLENPDTFIDAWLASHATGFLGAKIGAGLVDAKNAINSSPKDRDMALRRLFGGAREAAQQPELRAQAMDAFTIARKTAEQDAVTLQARTMAEKTEDIRRSDPVYYSRLNDIYNSSLGSLSMARAAGISGGTANVRRRLVDPKTGQVTIVAERVNTLKALESRAKAAGYDTGEFVGMMQRTGATAGFGLKGADNERLLSATHGGLQNAVELYGLGAQYNGGGRKGARRFLNTLSGAIGRGGLDVTAASQVYGAGAGAITSGTFQGTGAGAAGFLTTLATAAYGGSPGGDMLGARQVGAGMGGMGAVFSGGLDPLQQAINASAALTAAGSMPAGAKEALMQMSPASLMGIIKSGQVPPELSTLFPQGTSAGQILSVVKSYYAEVIRQTITSRVPESVLSGTKTGEARAAVLAGGGDASKYLAGATNRTERRAREAAVGNLYRLSGFESDTATGMVKIDRAVRGGKKLRGRGPVQTASMKSLAGRSATAASKGDYREALRRSVQEEALGQDIDASPDQADAEETALRKSMKGVTDAGGDATTAAENVAAALKVFVRAITDIAEGRAKAGPPMSYR